MQTRLLSVHLLAVIRHTRHPEMPWGARDMVTKSGGEAKIGVLRASGSSRLLALALAAFLPPPLAAFGPEPTPRSQLAGAWQRKGWNKVECRRHLHLLERLVSSRERCGTFFDRGMMNATPKYNEASQENVRAPLFSLIIGLLYFVLRQTGAVCLTVKLWEQDAGRGTLRGRRVR